MKIYTNKQIRDFIRCPQFGDIKYGKWGALKLEVKETLKNLVDTLDSADYIIKNQQQRIDKAIEHLEESIDIIKGDGTIPIYSGNVRRRYLKPVLDILKGEDKE